MRDATAANASAAAVSACLCCTIAPARAALAAAVRFFDLDGRAMKPLRERQSMQRLVALLLPPPPLLPPRRHDAGHGFAARKLVYTSPERIKSCCRCQPVSMRDKTAFAISRNLITHTTRRLTCLRPAKITLQNV